MIKNKVAFLMALIGVFGVSLKAQEKVLTKEDAIALALENNYGINVAKNQVEVAGNNKGIMNSGYLPTLTGSAGASYSRDDSVIEFPGQFNEDGTPREDVELDKAEAQSYSSALTASYTLFDGLGRFYNYKRLKEQYQLSELQARETIENTIVQLFSVYYEIARLTENENVLRKTLDISRDRYTRSEYSFEYGQSTKLDILNAQVDITNDSINVLNARQQLANTKRDLNVLLSQDLNMLYTVDTLVTFIPKIKLEEFVGQAKLNNVSLLQTERNLAINSYDIKVQKSGYLPTIGLSGSYGWNLNQSAQSAFFPGTNTDNTSFDLGASLSWNLFDGGGTNVRVKNAKIAYENQELLKKQIELEVDRDIQNAMAIYENKLVIYTIQEQNVVTNQNNFERSKEQFQLGRITSIEFRQAQINLLNAQTNKNLAKYEAKLAELQLLQLTGQLLNVEL
ncbi:TolC family protein [Maribacter sp. TH_r10]|uniref:TolC family protein n=1 Tax=Maribacter luteus TaxID=2594478 RepID=A0A6I2MG11_9FLAO|nr:MULTISPECIES: TolC family protein [Maribacter]MDV7138168.1 TolC family protein [Maribacter sp. TH_r10]MRX62668.1 TolC family protein [Maribacter luteus]